MALAHGGKHYTPPPLPCALARDLSILPLWYGNKGATVLVSETLDDTWQKELRRLFSVDADWIYVKKSSNDINCFCSITECSPWGWSASVKNQLLLMGVSPECFPSDFQIDLLRRLSHRSVSIHILNRLNELYNFSSIIVPQEFRDMSEIKVFVEKFPAVVLKSPWSSSGRGIYWCKGIFDRQIENWCRGVLLRQQSIIAEYCYPKILDFAMEFYREGNSVSFAGYSCFYADDKGAYQGNWLAPDSTIEQYLVTYVGAELLYSLKTNMQKILAELLNDSGYKGYMGVDMMVFRDEEKAGFSVHPCVELNLRMSMGMVSRILFDRYVSPGSTGYYYVDFQESGGELLKLHEESISASPIQLNNGKIEKGYWALSPVSAHTQFRAYADITDRKETRPSRFLRLSEK